MEAGEMSPDRRRGFVGLAESGYNTGREFSQVRP